MPLRLVNGKLVNDDGETVDGADDVTPVSGASRDELRCEECGTPLVYAGRGRYPRFCDDHKPVSPSRSSSGSTTPRRSSTLRNEAALRESLTARYLMLSNIAALRHPAYASSIRDKIERAVEADIAYAKVNPSFRRVLEGMLEKTAAAEVIAVHVSMFAPVIVGEAANRGRKKTPQPARGRPEASSQESPRRQPPPQPSPSPHPSPEPSAERVTHLRRVPDEGLFPGEHEGSGEGEVTEYDDLPDADGMPGV
jgi:hypothetical protein